MNLFQSCCFSSGRDHFYAFNESRLDAVRKGLAWLNDPKYFKKVKISPSAVIKMMMHGQSGVDKGVKKAGKPVEVMGLLLGRPDYEDPHLLIISDAQALPIEGFETRVIADDENVMNYMIELGEINEISRRERFCGWYHTHPFDVDVNSHCFLSTTDISTQLQWQRAEDPHGNPWLAIVIDPLRSLVKGHPELMAFRVYPPDYNPPLNETPDGKIVVDDRARVEKWGACWNRYYRLEVSYFMSTLAQNTLGILKNNFLWMNAITSTPLLEPGELHGSDPHIVCVNILLHSILFILENDQRTAERLSTIADKLELVDNGHSSPGQSIYGQVHVASQSEAGGELNAREENSLLKTSQVISHSLRTSLLPLDLLN